MTAVPFFDALTARAQKADSLLCVGLDPRAGDVAGLRAECERIIDAAAEVAAAFKPNSAFFEAHGAEGWQALHDVIAYVPRDIPVILDAKRGDIADTAEAYARAIFDSLGAQAVTASPYLGGDAVGPLLRRPEYGVFVLCRTSNPGADEIQNLRVSGSAAEAPLYEVVAQLAQAWNTHGNVGLVVGATYPQALARLRELAPDLWFLVPGVGAQGGDLAAALGAGLRPDGLGVLVSVSRAISQAADPRAEAMRLRQEIQKAQAARRKGPSEAAPSPDAPTSAFQQLARDLIATGCVRFGQYTLKSGAASPIYLDLRRLITYPAVLRRVARAYAILLRGLGFDRLAGIPYAGLPIATAVALEMDRPLIYPRRETKDYGTRAAIEGDFEPGEVAAVIDDLATTGGTKIESIQKLETAGLRVRDIIVLIDREQGAGPMLAEAGYQLHAVATLGNLLDEWRRSEAISAEQHAEVREFLARS